MSDTDIVIKITDLVKEYKMYTNKKDRLLEALLLIIKNILILRQWII